MKYLIAFDIVDDRVRYRAVKVLLEYGYRVQKSVFEAFLSAESRDECAEKLTTVIDEKTDSVRFYPLCRDCAAKVSILGIGVSVEKTDYLIV
jgi:CRISPR-associated protein Cas2